METRRRKVLGWLWPVLFLVVIVWGIGSVQAQTIGKVIDQTNYKEYEALLIPAQLNAVKRGEWILPTANLGFPLKHSDRFLDASEKNAGKYDIDAEGNLIDKSTGKFPTYNVYGFPFPKIDPKDPKVAEKIIWNFTFQKWRFMANNAPSYLKLISKDAKEPHVVIEGAAWQLTFQGRRPGQELKSEKGFLYNNMYPMLAPMAFWLRAKRMPGNTT